MIEIPADKFSKRKGMTITHDVIHYTAGGSGRGLAKWWANPQSRVSAHFIICRDGTVIQCVDLAKKAWHAGRSRTHRYGEMTSNVNEFSIGYELANRGRLTEIDGEFYYPHGGDFKKYNGPPPVEKSMFERKRRIGGHWEPYTFAQIEALKETILHVDNVLGWKRTIVGHQEISPGRKIDPGPLFPWSEFRG